MVFNYKGVAESVCLAGDFNQWSPDSHCLKHNGDNWKIMVALTPGAHRYAFILDQTRWVPDPNAMLMEGDGFGRQNSVIIVE